ncbi:MAG: hypothetical protein NXH70_02575 [Hyphomonas sp.]|nr:hypothetical protein [Hyphomonas sp.]
MSYVETLDMPIRSFWSFAKNINRIRAQSELRLMDVFHSGQSAEYAEKVRAKLEEELGKVMKAPPKPIDHTAGVNKLKALAT